MNSSQQPAPAAECNVCVSSENLMRCGKCKHTFYCSKEHQVTDWKTHKKICKKIAEAHNRNGHITATMPSEGSSETEILSSASESLNNNFEEKPYINYNISPPYNTESTKDTIKQFSEVSLSEGYSDSVESLASMVIKDMNEYGVCVLDNFLGHANGLKVLEEVKKIKEEGRLQNGQVVKKDRGKDEDTKTIRSDKICWLNGTEKGCSHIKNYIAKVDAIILTANRQHNNLKLGNYNINGRTKAMVACYPGNASHYVQHVDNPNRDGRCITSIYYLNPEWDAEKCGGVLWIYPEGTTEVCKVAPIFDRLLLFWSDRRNPHEVRPAYCDRYAITLWYFDAKERAEAKKRFEKDCADNHKKMPSA